MATNVTSSLDIKLIDDVSGPAKKVVQALKEAETRTKAISDALSKAGTTDRLSAQLQKVGASAKHVEAVATAWKDYARANNLAESSSQWTKSQIASVRQWERQTITSVKNVLREEEAVFNARRRLQERMQQEQEKHLGRMARLGKNAREAAGMAAGFAAGPGLLHGTKEATLAGARLQSEKVRMGAAGMSADEVASASRQSAQLAAAYPLVKRDAILETYKELRSVLLHPQEVPELLPTVVKAKAALDANDRTGHSSEGLQFAVKGAEVLGLAKDPKRFAEYMDAVVKAQQVMGKTINPEQIFEIAKYSKASGAGLSDRFKLTTALSLAQEMGGSTTGNAVDQFEKQIIGGFQGPNHSAAKEFVRLGLANKDDFELNKSGDIKGMKPGKKVAGSSLAQSDPDQWVYKYLLPALEKAGITSEQDQISQIRRMFTAGRAADLVTKLVTQRESFENHAKLYGEAKGSDAVVGNQKDPFVGFDSLKNSLDSFAGTLTSPIMENAASVMSALAKSIGAFGESLDGWQKAHPELAKVAAGGALTAGVVGGGAATYGLLSGLSSGFGLKGSALALDESAAALSAAAMKLGAEGSLAGAAGGLGGKGGKGGNGLPGKIPLALAGNAPVLLDALSDIGRTPDERKAHAQAQATAGQQFGDGVDKWWGDTMPSWLQPGVGQKWISGLLSGADEAKAKAAEAGAAINQSLTVTAKPTVDTSGIEAATQRVQELRRALEGIPGAVAGAAAQAGRVSGHVPALGPAQRGRFGVGGVQGE